MKPYEAREIAAKAWCDSSTSHLDMIPELAEAFAKILVEEVAALAEQNKKLRKVLLRLACLGNGDQYGNSIGNCIAQEALSSPDLATPILNKIKAETLEAFKVELMHLVANGEASLSETSVAVDALEARIDKLTNKERGETR